MIQFIYLVSVFPTHVCWCCLVVISECIKMIWFFVQQRIKYNEQSQYLVCTLSSLDKCQVLSQCLHFRMVPAFESSIWLKHCFLFYKENLKWWSICASIFHAHKNSLISPVLEAIWQLLKHLTGARSSCLPFGLWKLVSFAL